MTDAAISEQQRLALEEYRVASVLTRYSVACDERDREELATLFHPDATAVYDKDADLVGNTAIAEWISSATAHLRWQQHAVRVMTVDIDGDRARAVSYLTSHQVAFDTPDVTLMMNSRYDTEHALADGRWVITKLLLTVGTVENRPIQLGTLVPDSNSEVSND
ncbi:nuclear transport factor 2 family protein [Gordonia humi]|uniref:Uncharacterized protein (TIGR02246 family) n=1 Tax=Gordonia humi TaxID=686429 RepID=A0A840EWP0_9ACTN|nr:nuclear transport factor 2 family protein [Gordonia humi]MBB4134236.1 uncharacterized protein (TIGR02246 family) [Gordonia humi]